MNLHLSFGPTLVIYFDFSYKAFLIQNNQIINFIFLHSMNNYYYDFFS